MSSMLVFRLVTVLSLMGIRDAASTPGLSDQGPPYDLNHTALGCSASLPCHCLLSHETGEPEKVINCSSRNLKEVPGFLTLTGYPFDRLLLDNNAIKDIPKNAFSGLEVSIIDLSNNSISSVSDNGFSDLGALEELHMDNCKLTSSPLSMQFLTNLRKLSFKNCDIKQITKAAFTPLTELEELDLSGNPLQFSPPFEAFDKLKKLKFLKLSDCDLSSLPVDVLEHLKNLQHLTLKNNNITSLGSDVFQSVPELKELDLEGNSIVFKSFKEFEVLKHLKVLKLGHCRLGTVDFHLVRHIPHVHTLVIRHCHVQKVTNGAFRNLFHLTKLDLSGNPKVKISDHVFHGLEDRLKFVGIENMNLSSFPTSAFRKLFVLKKIKAGRNVIKSLNKGVLHGLKGRHVEVHLEKNEITEIGEGILHGVRRPVKLYLQQNNVSSLSFISRDPCAFYESEINLEDNPIRCDCATASTLQMKAFTVHGKCQSGDSIFRDLPLMPKFKEAPKDDTDYLVTVAANHCPAMTQNKTHERYDCACEEWMWYNGTKVCSGEGGLLPSHGLLYYVLLPLLVFVSL